MTKLNNKKLGFTLVEILIVLTIISIIAALATIAYDNYLTSARDHQRASDINRIQLALEQYHRDEGFYPSTLTPGQALIGSTSSTTYMAIVPEPPTTVDGACSDSNYTYNQNSADSYTLTFCLGSQTGDMTAGVSCATPNGIEACSTNP